MLNAAALSLASSAVWSRNIGETSCKWRRPYSPDGRTFIVWTVIYTTTLASCAAQLTGQVPVLGWWTNFFWALAFALCAVWTPLFDGESPEALRAAASVLLAGAAAAVMGVAEERAWMNKELRLELTLLTAPLGLLAGWLCVAAALGWGISNAALDPLVGPLEECRVPPRRKDESQAQYRARRRVLYRQAYARMPAEVSIVPLGIAAAVAWLAALVPDPLLVVPTAWAVVNLKAFPSCMYLAALLVLSAGVALSLLRAFVWDM